MNASSVALRKLARAALVVATTLGCSGQPPAPPPSLQRYEFEAEKMATTFRLVFYAMSPAEAAAASKAAFQRIDTLESYFSDYRPDSEVSGLKRLGADAPRGPIAISPDLLAVLTVAQKVSADSDGAFDVTVGPLVELWRTAQRREALPSANAIAAARARVGWKKLLVDERGGVSFTVAAMALDLGGIAKGYAADAALAVLAAKGSTRALVAAGGDVATNDPPPGETGWRVELAEFDDDPTFEKRADAPPSARTVLLVAHQAVSTSGDRWRHVEIGGVRYSHVLDPATGFGLTRRVLATIVAPDGTTADAMTKVASIFEPERALAFVAQHPGVETRVVTLESGIARTRTSPGFAKLIAPPAPPPASAPSAK